MSGPGTRFAQESEREFADGAVIFAEGDDSRELYVVQRGSVEITKRIGGDDVRLGTLSRGEFLGEMALIESLPRSATARALGPTRLLVVQPGGFLLKIRRDPTFAFELLQQLSGRIRTTNERLLAALQREAHPSQAIAEIVQRAEFLTADRKPEGEG